MENKLFDNILNLEPEKIVFFYGGKAYVHGGRKHNNLGYLV